MSLNILLADDEKDFVDTLAERRSLRGHFVRVVYDGLSLVEAVTQAKPDIVVLDLYMPGLTGDEAVRRLRDMHADLPVILLTGNEVTAEDNTLPLPAAACLTKPLALNDLLTAIHSAVGAPDKS